MIRYLNQADIARLLGVNRQTVTNYISRYSTYPEPDAVIGNDKVNEGRNAFYGWLPCRAAEWLAWQKSDRQERIPRHLTEDEIDAGRSPAGGWTRDTLARWGVPWPPPKGWRQALLDGTPIPIVKPPQDQEVLCEDAEGWGLNPFPG
jgi:hypothetical protein